MQQTCADIAFLKSEISWISMIGIGYQELEYYFGLDKHII
jgi:hypothetical protein